MFGIVAFVMTVDRITKHIATTNLLPGDSIPLIPNIFHLTLVYNKGAGFGLFTGQRVFFILLAIGTVLGILFFIWKRRIRSRLLVVGLALIVAGALGNMIDRLRTGYVIDFFDLKIWPVFNIADSAISIGAVMIAWILFFSKENES